MWIPFTRFLLPLAVTAMVLELGSQVLNAGMARMPRATETLAGYGLAWGLVLFLASPLAQAKELGLVLAVDRESLRPVRRFVAMAGVTLSVGLASLAVTPAGDWVIEGLHGVDPHLGAIVRVALLWLAPYPLLKALSLLHAGLLLRARRTVVVSYATLANLGVSIATVFLLLAVPLVRAEPIRLPILALYAGLAVELGIIFWGYRRGWRPVQRAGAPAPVPGYGAIIRFFWPLALIMVIQELSRPVINLFVARQTQGDAAGAALAILTVVYTLGRLPYGWLNEIRSLAPAFQEQRGALAAIRRFALACGGISFAMMLLLFWTPLRGVILEGLIGLTPALAQGAVIPLRIISFLSFVVMARAYLHGVGLVERRTAAMAPSAPARFAAILAALMLLPRWGITGATLGISALVTGFVVETLLVWWGVRGRALLLPASSAGGRAAPSGPL